MCEQGLFENKEGLSVKWNMIKYMETMFGAAVMVVQSVVRTAFLIFKMSLKIQPAICFFTKILKCR